MKQRTHNSFFSPQGPGRKNVNHINMRMYHSSSDSLVLHMSFRDVKKGERKIFLPSVQYMMISTLVAKSSLFFLKVQQQ